jgi:hypothetical protein
MDWKHEHKNDKEDTTTCLRRRHSIFYVVYLQEFWLAAHYLEYASFRILPLFGKNQTKQLFLF